MKRVEAIIRQERVSGVLSALNNIGLGRTTVTEVRNHGDEAGVKRVWRGMTYSEEYMPKTKIEVLVAEQLVQRVVAVIREHASAGCAGDGTIIVVAVDEIIDVGTGNHSPSPEPLAAIAV